MSVERRGWLYKRLRGANCILALIYCSVTQTGSPADQSGSGLLLNTYSRLPLLYIYIYIYSVPLEPSLFLLFNDYAPFTL